MGGLAFTVFKFSIKITCLLPEEKRQPGIKYGVPMPLVGEILSAQTLPLIHVLAGK